MFLLRKRTVWACSSKGRIVILGRIVSASGQIFRSDFRPQDEIFRPGIPFRPLDEQALNDSYVLTHRLMQVQGDYTVGGTLFVISSLCPVVSKLRQDRNQILKVRIPHHDFL